MASSYDSRLITPPTEEEEIYPYRRVWVSIVLESSILFTLTVALFVLTGFINTQNIPASLLQLINLVLACVPLLLWLVFSWWRERSVPQPRQNLIAVVIVTALAANALGLPVINDIFQVERWLSLESAINRIVGYSFTIRIVQSIIVYLVVRYTAWSTNFRTRHDGIAYGRAAALGYATVLNLQFVLTQISEPNITAMNIFNQTAVLIGTGIILGYGLVETRLNNQPFPLLMVAMVALSSFVTGLAIPLVSGFTNASLSTIVPISTASPLLGFLFSAGLLIIVGLIFWLLFNNTDREEIHTPEGFLS